MMLVSQKKAGLWINESKPEAGPLAEQIKAWFTSRHWGILTRWDEIKTADVQLIISLGGDGTLLEAAREAAPWQIPVLGVNLGRLGFLCEIERGELFSVLEKVVQGDYTIEKRLMLETRMEEAGKIKTRLALNDVVFTRHGGGVVTLSAILTGEPFISYPADGLIVATPTGSTAYSLSAGGPIISPDVEGIILTPLAPHSLSARPMIVAQHQEIEIYLPQAGESCLVTFDGQQPFHLQAGERVKISASPLKAQLIRFGMRSFPTVVREKLRER